MLFTCLNLMFDLILKTGEIFDKMEIMPKTICTMHKRLKFGKKKLL